MFKLILRQVGKHWKGLLPLAIVWILAGYYFYYNKHTFLSRISGWFVELPGPGQQNPVRAFTYVQQARERLRDGNVGTYCTTFESESCAGEFRRLGQIRLDLMARACRNIPARYRGRVEAHRPHWLKKLREWNLLTQSEESVPGGVDPEDIVEPEEYWKNNRLLVLRSLKDLVDAMAFAYEINPTDLGEQTGKTILLPEEITKYSRALCADELGILAWGDYVEFLELQAYQKIKKRNPEFEKNFIYPVERELLVLEELKNNRTYIKALLNYTAGDTPSEGAERTVCGGSDYRLSCISPAEAGVVYNKLLYILPDADQLIYRLKLSHLYLLRNSRGEKGFIEPALDNLEWAAQGAYGTEREARLGLTRVFLMQNDYERAYEQTRLLYLAGARSQNFRRLFRLTLMGLNRHRDADCFAEYSKLSYGLRAHCKKLNFAPISETTQPR